MGIMPFTLLMWQPHQLYSFHLSELPGAHLLPVVLPDHTLSAHPALHAPLPSPGLPLLPTQPSLTFCPCSPFCILRSYAQPYLNPTACLHSACTHAGEHSWGTADFPPDSEPQISMGTVTALQHYDSCLAASVWRPSLSPLAGITAWPAPPPSLCCWCGVGTQCAFKERVSRAVVRRAGEEQRPWMWRCRCQRQSLCYIL